MTIYLLVSSEFGNSDEAKVESVFFSYNKAHDAKIERDNKNKKVFYRIIPVKTATND